MFRPLVNRSTEDRILEVVKSAVKIEMEFMTRGPSWHALRSDGPENKYMADRLLVELLCKQVSNGIVELNSDLELYVYNLETPIDFMENMKTNFVEKKVGERWGSCRP